MPSSSSRSSSSSSRRSGSSSSTSTSRGSRSTPRSSTVSNNGACRAPLEKKKQKEVDVAYSSAPWP